MSPKRTRRRYPAAFTERQPLAELAARYQLASAQTTRQKQHLRQQAAQVFVADAPAPAAALPDVGPLYAAISRLQMENALLKKRSPDEYPQQRYLAQALDEVGSSVAARCQWLARSSYYQPTGESFLNLTLMRLLDEEFTRHNLKGVCGLTHHLRLAGYAVNEKRVRRLVRLMGYEPVYLKLRLAVPG